jgi:integrase
LQIRNALMVRLFYITGMRPMSLAGIRLADLTNEGVWITKKGGKRILQAIEADEIEIILHYVQWVLPHVTSEGHENTELYLFPSYRGKMMTRNAITTMFHDQLGTKLTPYSLRHGVAQGMWAQGATSADIVEVLGHDGVKSIKNYVTEHDLNRTRAVLEAFHPLFAKE